MIIDGAVAFIAGGAGGFGAATARGLHAAGATVVVGDLDEVKGRAVADRGRAGRGYCPRGPLIRGCRPNRCMKTSAVLACCS
jgi:NAD(P)-dependent dehydrogenase (short-subunit alcohol dehydrogenase family)